MKWSEFVDGIDHWSDERIIKNIGHKIKLALSMMLLAFGLVMLSGTVIVHASIEPKVRETSVILYTDDEPYIFHFTNLMPDAQVTYTSSKESVLIIKNSQAIPVKPGKATVTINIKQDDEKYQIKVKFKVKKVPAQEKTKDYDKLAAKAAKKLNKDAVKKSATLGIKDSDYIHSKEELDMRISDYSRKYLSFFVCVDDYSLLRSQEEYLDMFPFLSEFYYSDPLIYNNTHAVKINCKCKLSWMNYNERGVEAAIITGNTSFLNKDEKALYKKVLKAAKKLRKSKDYETVKAIYDYVIKLVDYEHDTSNIERYSLSGAFNYGKVTCSGYSKLFYFLCISNDINCIIVEGSSKKEESNDVDYISHAWNLVEINHKWYGIETTWDDCYDSEKGYTSTPYRYFLISDDTMKENHRWNESEYPAAVSKDLGIRYSYFEEYPMLTGETETMEYVKGVVNKFKNSDSNEYKLEFCETSFSKEVYKVVLQYLNECYKSGSVYWKDWNTDNMPFHGGWVYHITLYKK